MPPPALPDPAKEVRVPMQSFRQFISAIPRRKAGSGSGGGAGLRSLSGWARIRIVVSIIWIIPVGFARNDYIIKEAGDQAAFVERICSRPDDQDSKPCEREYLKTWNAQIKDHWTDSAVTSVGTLLLFWTVVYSGIGTFRWIRRGFNAPVPTVES